MLLRNMHLGVVSSFLFILKNHFILYVLYFAKRYLITVLILFYFSDDGKMDEK